MQTTSMNPQHFSISSPFHKKFVLGKNSHLKVKPLSSGPNRFEKTIQIFGEAVKKGVSPGLSVGIYVGQEKEDVCSPDSYWAETFGSRQIMPENLPLSLGTTFDLASLTKVLATATTITTLVERGWLEWNTCVSRLVPEFKHSTVQVKHLMAHTSGLPDWSPFWQEIRKVSHYSGPGFNYRESDIDSSGNLGGGLALVPIELRREILRDLVCKIDLEAKPEERELYSDLSFMLLGWVIEAVTQQRLDKAVQASVWNPLHMGGTHFFPVQVDPVSALHSESLQFGSEGVAATENCPWRGSVLAGQAHDDNCWAAGGIEGHAGAFGTLDDLMAFSKELLVGNFFQYKTMATIWSKISTTRTLGWDTPSGDNPAAGKYFSAKSVGHNGYTGPSLWIDPTEKVAVAILANRVHPTRENNQLKSLRGQLHDAIREDLGF